MSKVDEYLEKYYQLQKLEANCIFLEKAEKVAAEMDNLWYSMTELECEAVRTTVSRNPS